MEECADKMEKLLNVEMLDGLVTKEMKSLALFVWLAQSGPV
jgi:hypothetical protein